MIMKKIKNNNYLNKIKDNFIKNSKVIFVFFLFIIQYAFLRRSWKKIRKIKKRD